MKYSPTYFIKVINDMEEKEIISSLCSLEVEALDALATMFLDNNMMLSAVTRGHDDKFPQLLAKERLIAALERIK